MGRVNVLKRTNAADLSVFESKVCENALAKVLMSKQSCSLLLMDS